MIRFLFITVNHRKQMHCKKQSSNEQLKVYSKAVAIFNAGRNKIRHLISTF